MRGAAAGGDRLRSALLRQIELDAVLDELRRLLGSLSPGEKRAGLVADDLHQTLVVAQAILNLVWISAKFFNLSV